MKMYLTISRLAIIGGVVLCAASHARLDAKETTSADGYVRFDEHRSTVTGNDSPQKRTVVQTPCAGR